MKSFRLTSFGSSVDASMAAMALSMFFTRFRIFWRALLAQLRKDLFGVLAVAHEEFQPLLIIISPAPLDGGNAEVHALANVAAREDVQSCLPDVVSPHFVGGREGFDGADEVGQERGEFAVVESFRALE